MSIERVIDRELTAHVVEVVCAYAPKAIRNRFQSKTFRCPVPLWRIRRAHDSGKLD